MIKFSRVRNGQTLRAVAPNGTTFSMDAKSSYGYVMAPGYGMDMLHNCVLHSVGDMRKLFRRLAAK